MDNQDLKVFINSTINYFKTVSGIEAELGIPYLLGEAKVLMDFTAVIGISGERRGGLYFTASRNLVAAMVTLLLDDKAPDERMLFDMVGELANIISGNAREVFGANFLISVPMVITGAPSRIKIPAPTYAIPIRWQGEEALLGIGFKQ